MQAFNNQWFMILSVEVGCLIPPKQIPSIAHLVTTVLSSKGHLERKSYTGSAKWAEESALRQTLYYAKWVVCNEMINTSCNKIC